MSKLIITAGPSPSGKTTWAIARCQNHENWIYASQRRDALRLLDNGWNVVLDEERPDQSDVDVTGFGANSVSVKNFSPLS